LSLKLEVLCEGRKVHLDLGVTKGGELGSDRHCAERESATPTAHLYWQKEIGILK